MTEYVVIAGLSGAGRSQAANSFEDLGWFVIDNLPPALIPKVGELARAPGSSIERVALVAGTGPHHGEIGTALAELRSSGERVRILFLEAPTETLVRRYEDTRRRHPFDPDLGLAEAIEAEREALGPLKAEADLLIDTGELNVNQLRGRIRELFADEAGTRTMRTSVMSFGYKHGIPADADLVIDCRFLPNPHWIEDLRPQTGLDEPVRAYVMGQAVSGAFIERLERLLGLLMPSYVREGKSYLTIAFGCTGGRHRSVAIAEEVGAFLDRLGYEPVVAHRDVGR
jgi:RNase adapter protein RapZ